MFNTELFKILDTINNYSFEVIYVVDKCTDNTLEILKNISNNYPNITIISLSKRFGHQLSLVAGIDISSGDAVIMMDCDLEHPPSLIPLLIEKFEEGFEVVNTIRKYNKKVSLFKSISSKLFYKFLNSISEQSFSEGSADFRIISKKVAAIFKNNIREKNQFLRGLFQWVGFKQTSVSYISGFRQGGKTKYKFNKLISFALNGILSFSKLPLKISISIGILFSLFGFIYAIYSTIMYLINKANIPSGWTTIIVFQSITAGLILIVLGIIGEYIGAIFDEVKNRPLYIIDEIIKSPTLET